MAKLEALAKLSSEEDGEFNGHALGLMVMKRLVAVPENGHEKGEVGEEELWEAVCLLGDAHIC